MRRTSADSVRVCPVPALAPGEAAGQGASMESQQAEHAHYADLRDYARRLGVQPVVLRRQLVADGVELIEVSPRVHRVEAVAIEGWLELRKQRTREALEQEQRKADYIVGRQPKKRRPVFTRQ